MSNQRVARPSTSRVTSGIILTVLAALSFGSTGFLANHLADQGNPGVVIGFYESLFGLALVLAINVHHAGRPRATRVAMRRAVVALDVPPQYLLVDAVNLGSEIDPGAPTLNTFVFDSYAGAATAAPASPPPAPPKRTVTSRVAS